MKKLILLLTVLLVGCSHLVTVRLTSEDYVPPATVPFTNASDRQEYLAYFEKAWLELVTNRVYRVDLKKSIVIVDSKDAIVLGNTRPSEAGARDGYRNAMSQIEDMIDQIFTDAGQDPFRERANKAMDDTAE